MKRINIQNILNHPLIAALAGVLWVFCSISCTDEQSLLSPASGDTSTTLRIQTKGLVIDPNADPTLAELEGYVKTLRIFFFNKDGQNEGYMWYSNDLSEETLYKEGESDAYITIALDEENSFTPGNYEVYAVANETAGLFDGLELTEEANGFTPLDSKVTVKDIQDITFTVSEPPTSLTPTVDAPILMSATEEEAILDGNNNMIIELKRTVGKVELASVTLKKGTEETSLENYTYTLSASGTVLGTFPLFDGGTPGTDKKNLSVASTSLPLYLSESAESAVEISVTVNYDSQSYTGKLSSPVQIVRNNCIQLNAIITQVEEENCLLLQSSIAGWTSEELKPEYE